MPVTLTHVARKAGVSLATASRAFSDPSRLADGTRERVLRTAAELGYAVPQAALAGRTLAIVVPDAASPVYAKLLKGMLERAWHGRHQLVLFDTDEDLRREREQIERARSYDGMLLCSPRLPDDEVRSAAGDTPTVIVNRAIEGYTSVLMDTERGPRQAVDHLFALGHRHIAYASGPRHSWADNRRGDAISRACDDIGARLTRLDHQAASIQGGRAAAATVLASGATAVVAYNDLVALGIDAGITDLGRHCPEDLSIIGVDDIDMAATRHPGLTTIRLAIDRCGALSIEAILDTLRGARPSEITGIDSQLIVRGSTAPPR